MTLGTVVVDEKVFTITRIFLRAGTFVVEASITTTAELTLSGGMDCRIHDPEGGLVAVLRLPLKQPVTAKGEPRKPATMTLNLPLGFTEFVGAAAWPAR